MLKNSAKFLELKIQADSVDASNLIGVGELLLLGVEQVVCVEEDFAVLHGLVSHLEVEREARVKLRLAIHGEEGALADEVAVGGDVEIVGRLIDEAEHAIDRGSGLMLMSVYKFRGDALALAHHVLAAPLAQVIFEGVIEREGVVICRPVDGHVVLPLPPSLAELGGESLLLGGRE